MNFIQRIFNKKNKDKNMVDTQLTQIREHLEKFKKFQWVKGDHVGKITEFRDIVHEADKDIIWVMFADGSRINFKKLDEYMLCARTEGELLDIPVQNNAQIQGGDGVQQSTATIKGPSAKIAPPLSPVQALLKKQKPNPVDINMVITLNVPSVELYGVICQSFDNAEDEIVDFVVSGLDTAALKETLKLAIKNFYSVEPKTTSIAEHGQQ